MTEEEIKQRDEEYQKQHNLIIQAFKIFKEDYKDVYEGFAFMGILEKDLLLSYPLIHTNALAKLREAIDVGHYHLRSRATYRLLCDDIDDPSQREVFREDFGLNKHPKVSDSLKWITESSIIDHYFFVGIRKATGDEEDKESRVVLGWSKTDLFYSVVCARRMYELTEHLVRNGFLNSYDILEHEKAIIDSCNNQQDKEKPPPTDQMAIPTLIMTGTSVVETPTELFERISSQLVQQLAIFHYKGLNKFNALAVILNLTSLFIGQFLGVLVQQDKADALLLMRETFLRLKLCTVEEFEEIYNIALSITTEEMQEFSIKLFSKEQNGG